MIYTTISRAAYHLALDAEPLTQDYRAMAFPETWHDSVLALCNVGRADDAEPLRTVPTYRMDGVLQTLAPELIVRGRTRDPLKQAEDHWLYVPADIAHPLPDRTFDQLVGAWLRDLQPLQEHRPLLIDTIGALRADPPVWHGVTVDLLGTPSTEGGTAAPSARQYQLATDALARRILTLEPYDTGVGTLRFRAVPRGPRDRGAELMSQPLQHDVKGRTWWYSVVINISLHTVPFDPQPRLHLHTGIRKWATHPDAKSGRLRLPYRRATTIYLRPEIPWLPGAPDSHRYAVNPLTWNRKENEYDWKNGGPASLLRHLALGQSFPIPKDLLADPLLWMGEGPGTRAFIVHSNHMGGHGIGSGFMSHQRSKITEWAEQALPEGLRRVPSLTRSRLGTSGPANPRSSAQGAKKDLDSIRTAQARRAALATAVRLNAGEDIATLATLVDPSSSPSVLRTRLLWQTHRLRDAAITALTALLGLDGDGGAPSPEFADERYDHAVPGDPVILRWQTPELTVELRCLRIASGVADKLGVDSKARPKRKALADAIAARRAALTRFLDADGAERDRPELALVEIDRRKDFPTSLDDPKFAIRLGSADAGVLTQFALVPRKVADGHNSEKNVDHRVDSAWQDGLRQLGVRVLPEHTLGGNLPAGLRYASVFMVKRRKDGPTRLPRHTPVSVMVTPLAPGSGMAAITGWDPDAAEWIPYPKLLLRLVKIAEIPDVALDEDDERAAADAAAIVPGQRAQEPASPDAPVPPRRRATYWVWKQDIDEQRRETGRYLQKMIRSLQGHPTALLTHSQNSRMHWPWLQDGQTEMDLIKTGHAPAAGLTPDLRLIRVRGAAGRETPQWWGDAAPGGVNGLPSGLWKETSQDTDAAGRIFYSTTPKAATFKASAAEADRFAPRPLTRGTRVGELTVDAHIPAWNPALVELAVLGCQPDDDPEAFALAVHQLRQAPDYRDALSLPLPLHLAGLAQQYVLPMVADGEEEASDEEAADALDGARNGSQDESADQDPELLQAPGLAQAPEDDAQLTLFPL